MEKVCQLKTPDSATIPKGSSTTGPPEEPSMASEPVDFFLRIEDLEIQLEIAGE